jgi:hypothetical protein
MPSALDLAEICCPHRSEDCELGLPGGWWRVDLHRPSLFLPIRVALSIRAEWRREIWPVILIGTNHQPAMVFNDASAQIVATADSQPTPAFGLRSKDQSRFWT